MVNKKESKYAQRNTRRREVARGLLTALALGAGFGHFLRPTIENHVVEPIKAAVEASDPTIQYIANHEFIDKGGTRAQMAKWAERLANLDARGTIDGASLDAIFFYEDVIRKKTAEEFGEAPENYGLWSVPAALYDLE